MAGFDIAGARAAGYSDAEIAAHLAKEGSSSFDFSGATKAGYTPGEILDHLDPQPSGVMAGLAHGTAGLFQGYANTAHVYGGDGDTAPDADPNYKPAQIIPQGGHWYDPTSYNWKQVPQAVAEMAPGMGADIAAAKAGQSILGSVAGVPGRLIGGALGGVGSYLLRTRGDIAKQDAQIRSGDENAVPNSEDKTRALLTGAAESVPQMVGVGRFLQGPARAGQSALARLATTTATEAGTGAAQNAIQQGGATIGTPGGMQIDPNQVAAAGVVGGATGGALGVPRLLTDVHTSHVFRHIDANEELAPAASAFANRIQDAAGGRNLSNPTVGGDAFTKARQGVHSELSDAVKGIQNPLGPDAENVLNFIKSGKSPTEADYSTLKAGLGNDPQAANVLSLAHQAHVSNLVEDTGHLGDNSFTGGLGNKVAQMSGLSGHSAGKAVIGTLLAEHLGSHLITYNPASLGLVAGAYGLTRLMDNLSGARSPANRFAQRYADPGAPTRFTPTPQQPPQGDQAGPTGPKIPLAPTPWGPEGPLPPDAPAAVKQMPLTGIPEDVAKNTKALSGYLQNVSDMRDANERGDTRALMQDATGLMAARKAQSSAEKSALREQMQDATGLTAARRANGAVDQAGVREQVQDASGLMAARRAQAMAEQAAQRSQVQDASGQMAARRANGAQAATAQRAQMLDASQIMAARRAAASLAGANTQAQAADATSIMAARAAHARLLAANTVQPEDPKAARREQMWEAEQLMSARRANGKLEEAQAEATAPQDTAPAAPLGPVAEKIRKKSGNAKVETSSSAPAEEEGYRPIPEDQMRNKGVSSRDIAERDVASGKYNPAVTRAYKNSIIDAHVSRIKALSDLADTHPQDEDHLAALLDQLRELSSGAQARKAVAHYSKMMSPEGAAATKAALDGKFIVRVWGQR